MSKDELWGHIHAERAALRDILAGLTPEQWDVPSLCGGWRVREVAAHVLSSPASTSMQAARELLRDRGRLNTMIDRVAREGAMVPTEEILAGYDAVATSRHHPPGTTVTDPLADVLVHTQDIVRPLGIGYSPAPATVLLALPRSRQAAMLFGTRRHLAELRLEATDSAYVGGKGARLVRAPGIELLLLITGRLKAEDLAEV